jgi:hypothetical protein
MDFNKSVNTDIIKFDNYITNTFEFLPKEITWKKYNRLWGDTTHRICSYVAMFYPSLAKYFIEKYAPNNNDIVLDTFSGRGTTLLQARLMNKKSYAIDLNPFAFVLSRSKAKSFEVELIINRINEWEQEYEKMKSNYRVNRVNKNLKVYYSNKNLRQLFFVKKNFSEKYKTLSEIDNFILAITLGIMHGPMRKNGDSIYLSLSMSNHTSMSVNYVRNYSLKHNLVKPEFNIFEKIRNRANYIIKKSTFHLMWQM